MRHHESELLYHALCYEEGHPRRTQHILKVYALTKLLGEKEALSERDRQILQAAAILHDIAIQYCKAHYAGDACQANQQREAPHLVCDFLKQADYPDEYLPRILELVLLHHDYTDRPDPLLRLLIEADLIVNCYENHPTAADVSRFRPLFHSTTGKTLFTLCVNHTRSQEKDDGHKQTGSSDMGNTAVSSNSPNLNAAPSEGENVWKNGLTKTPNESCSSTTWPVMEK